MTDDLDKNILKNQIIDEKKLDQIIKSNSLNNVLGKDKKKKMEELCIRKKFKLQPSQKFLGDFFKKSNLKGLLVYHKIGAGKTCTAITVAEKIKNQLDIIIVLPAALINSFRGELRSECPGDEYISSDNRKKLNN